MSEALAWLLALCSVAGFVNVWALYRAKLLSGVSLLPTLIYSLTNIVQAYLFMEEGHRGAAFGSILCLTANALWLGLALTYRHAHRC